MADDPRTGELDALVKLRRWEDVPNAAFSTTPQYDAGVYAWSKLVPTGSALYIDSVQQNAAVTHHAWVRYTPDVNERTVTGQHVVETDEERYRVKRANKWRGLRVFLYLELELLGPIEVSDE